MRSETPRSAQRSEFAYRKATSRSSIACGCPRGAMGAGGARGASPEVGRSRYSNRLETNSPFSYRLATEGRTDWNDSWPGRKSDRDGGRSPRETDALAARDAIAAYERQ